MRVQSASVRSMFDVQARFHGLWLASVMAWPLPPLPRPPPRLRPPRLRPYLPGNLLNLWHSSLASPPRLASSHSRKSEPKRFLLQSLRRAQLRKESIRDGNLWPNESSTAQSLDRRFSRRSLGRIVENRPLSRPHPADSLPPRDMPSSKLWLSPARRLPPPTKM